MSYTLVLLIFSSIYIHKPFALSRSTSAVTIQAEKSHIFDDEQQPQDTRKCNDIGDVEPPKRAHIKILKKYFGHEEFREAQWKVGHVSVVGLYSGIVVALRQVKTMITRI